MPRQRGQHIRFSERLQHEGHPPGQARGKVRQAKSGKVRPLPAGHQQRRASRAHAVEQVEYATLPRCVTGNCVDIVQAHQVHLLQPRHHVRRQFRPRVEWQVRAAAPGVGGTPAGGLQQVALAHACQSRDIDKAFTCATCGLLQGGNDLAVLSTEKTLETGTVPQHETKRQLGIVHGSLHRPGRDRVGFRPRHACAMPCDSRSTRSRARSTAWKRAHCRAARPSTTPARCRCRG